MAMSHVILREFYIDRQCDYFNTYAKAYTDLPFAIVLEEHQGEFKAGRFLRASDLGHTSNNAQWKTVLFDTASSRFVVPNGSIGFRWSEEGRWKPELEGRGHGCRNRPPAQLRAGRRTLGRVHSPLFDLNGAGTHAGVVPVRQVQTPSGPLIVTTVFDLLAAHLGVRRKETDAHPEDYPSGYDDPQAYTPAWQEAITGVPAADAIRVAREFAENAEKTRGKSMIFLGAGTNHWFHSDMIYRASSTSQRFAAARGSTAAAGRITWARKRCDPGGLVPGGLRPGLAPAAAPAERDLPLVLCHRPVALRQPGLADAGFAAGEISDAAAPGGLQRHRRPARVAAVVPAVRPQPDRPRREAAAAGASSTRRSSPMWCSG